MSSPPSPRPCLFYAAGPGDVVSTFRQWQNSQDDRYRVAVTYSSQFFDLCRDLGARGVVISSSDRIDRIDTEQFYVENLPKPQLASGWRYHLNQLRYLKKIVTIATREGADAMVVSDSTGHLFALNWLVPAKIAIIPTLHCTVWPFLQQPKRLQRFFNQLSRRLYARRALGILCVSETIKAQLEDITTKDTRPVHRFRPFYHPEYFESIPAPNFTGSEFNLLFAGRIEENKGVFDLLEACHKLTPAIGKKTIWHIAGDGSCESQLHKRVEELGLGDRFILYGHCQRRKMAELIGQSHAFIVPTRSDFEEGFNKVVAEAVLSGRPVISSSACPANQDVRPALVEVAPGDIDGYIRAVTRLATDRNHYLEKQSACRSLQQQFYAQANSWRRQLMLILANYPATGGANQAIPFGLTARVR